MSPAPQNQEIPIAEMPSTEKSANDPGVEVRLLTNHADFHATLEVQMQVWGFSETDCVPPRFCAVAAGIGGLALGAFLGERMVGFSLLFPGVKDGGRPYWYSHMTGVLPAYQNRRVGRRIKLFQRQQAVRAGIDLIEWTFDPLEIRNAYFNIERLGVIVRHFLPNQYGITSSRLQRGLPTDRLVAEWHVTSERVERMIDGQSLESPAIAATIEIPSEIAGLRKTDGGKATEIQTKVREEFQQHLAKELTVVGYQITADAGIFQLAKL